MKDRAIVRAELDIRLGESAFIGVHLVLPYNVVSCLHHDYYLTFMDVFQDRLSHLGFVTVSGDAE